MHNRGRGARTSRNQCFVKCGKNWKRRDPRKRERGKNRRQEDDIADALLIRFLTVKRTDIYPLHSCLATTNRWWQACNRFLHTSSSHVRSCIANRNKTPLLPRRYGFEVRQFQLHPISLPRFSQWRSGYSTGEPPYGKNEREQRRSTMARKSPQRANQK